ncbi:hypothetical protein FHS79_002372 [Polymorphobacter multimanifer]|uniref:Uncharacterized protein n=2 Tax=Polymorphobacter multimanifer TaxID=1070431 RepID=A0A841L6F2_9SPHN|nr:hypothetical protein [Polymorphobacter multimanifer]MBB6228187.1 hypothetical protein [Polymorphobacter multimanifer]
MRMNGLLRWGLWVLALGCGPLLLFMAAHVVGLTEPNPNPVGLGMLFFVTVWPGVALVVAGLMLAVLRR